MNLTVNGKSLPVTSPPDTPLLYVLRDELGIDSPQFGCGLAQCGACSVLVDGQEVRSCVTPASMVVGKEVTTLEGLGSAEAPHRDRPPEEDAAETRGAVRHRADRPGQPDGVVDPGHARSLDSRPNPHRHCWRSRA